MLINNDEVLALAPVMPEMTEEELDAMFLSMRPTDEEIMRSDALEHMTPEYFA